MSQFLRLLAAGIAALMGLTYLRFSLFGLPTNAVEVAVIILFIGSFFVSTRKLNWPKPLVIGTLVLLLGILTSVFVAQDTARALGIWKGWFVIPLLYGVSLARLFDRDNIILVIRSLLAGVVLVGLYALAQYFGFIPLVAHQLEGGNLEQYVAQGRALAFYESPNYLAMFLTPAVLFLWGALDRDHWARVLLIIPVIAIGLSRSDVALLTLVLGAFVLLTHQRSWRLALGGVITLLTAAVIVGLAISEPTEVGSRTYIWGQAVSFIADSPLLGIGPGQFLHAIEQSSGDNPVYQQFIRAYALHAHNLYLNLWLSGGILALVGFLVVAFNALKQFIRSNSALATAAATGLLAILIHGLLDTTYFKNDLALFFWLLIAVGFIARTEPSETR